MMSKKRQSDTVVNEIRISNSHDRTIQFVLEPWANEISMPPGTTIEIVAKGPAGGFLDIDDRDDLVVVIAWSGSTVTVYQNGEVLIDARQPVPPIPAHMTMKGFLTTMFGPRSKSPKNTQSE